MTWKEKNWSRRKLIYGTILEISQRRRDKRQCREFLDLNMTPCEYGQLTLDLEVLVICIIIWTYIQRLSMKTQ